MIGSPRISHARMAGSSTTQGRHRTSEGAAAPQHGQERRDDRRPAGSTARGGCESAGSSAYGSLLHLNRPPTNLPKRLRAARRLLRQKAKWEEAEMWDGRQGVVELGGQLGGWTTSLWAVGSKMWVIQLSCEDINKRNDMQCGSLLRTLAGCSDFAKEQNQAINDLAL